MKYEIAARLDEKPADHCKGAIAEYAKRLTAYCKIGHRFIRKENAWNKIVSEKAADKELRIVIRPGESKVTSEDLSRMIGKWESSGIRRILFLIPDSAAAANAADEEIGTSELMPLSSFTMTSDMLTMILYEQIYRGYRILHNQPYHK